MSLIEVNFQSDTVRNIQPLHGMNSGPMTKVFTYDARPLFVRAGFPYARLHDVEYPYGSGEFVDIPCIFRNFDADETREENYNFALTDVYLEKCMEVGCEPLFRLGVSIEHAPVKRHVFPPKDFFKWARICEHIIRHYTEGWANGYTWNIRYWEIWKEADNCARGGTNMWCGTPEQFYELYCVSAVHLKKCFPHLKIGGCGYTRGVNSFTEEFFQYITSRPEPVPLDFYSWHRYTADIENIVTESAKVDGLLAKYGYTDTENVFDEWNYMRDWKDQADSYIVLKNHVGAAFCAGVLCSMQTKTSIHLAAYFEADVVKEWCGIFTVDKMGIGAQKATVAPLKPYYAFEAFNELYTMGSEKKVYCDSDTLCAAAASDGERAGLLISNYSDEDTELELSLSGIPEGMLEIRLTDEHRDFEKIMSLASAGTLRLHFPLSKNAFVYIGSPLRRETGSVPQSDL